MSNKISLKVILTFNDPIKDPIQVVKATRDALKSWAEGSESGLAPGNDTFTTCIEVSHLKKNDCISIERWKS